jgi:2-polyprenyl-3-methyl-5-hydroxy-6-metoxy-1,4-benzoquinol methylase
MRIIGLGALVFSIMACTVLDANIFAQGQRTDEQVWSGFLGYLKQAPPLSGPLDALRGFEKSLIAAAVPSEEATRQLAVVRRLISIRGDWWPLMFDRIYSSDRPSFSQKPSTVLVEAIEGRKPGRALDVAMGQGRNALFLAQRGWTVTGFDVSSEGLNVSRANAKKAGVSMTTQRSTIEDFDYGDAQWDLIALIYVPESALEGPAMIKLARALAPGGLLVIESFASPRQSALRRPVDIDPDLLRASLTAFDVLRFDDREAVSEWDPQPTRLCRVIARKR